MKEKVSSLLAVCYAAVLVFSPYASAQSVTKKESFSTSSSPGSRSVRSFSRESVEQTEGEEAISISGIPATGPGTGTALYYQVHVLGEVARPGVYRILPSDRATDAIKYAGGFLSGSSKRRVQLRRDGATQNLDIYAYQYKGKLEQNPYLSENDVIFVPIKKGEIQVEGPVNRPGHYEVFGPLSLKETVGLAGGVAPGFSEKQTIKIIRFGQSEQRTVIEARLDESAKTKVHPGDVVVLPHLLLAGKKFDYNVQRIPGDNIFYPTANDNVYVIGAVLAPGSYPFQPGFDYNDYIGLAGPTQDASVKRAKVITGNGKKVAVRSVKEINAGDTIVIPSRSFTFGNALQIFNTLTSTFLTVVTVREVFVKE